ncbi:hypothetical protein OHS18_21490 [Amycolatopsis sp. NBC_00355]|uniref:hypothetical protein n=1 Tax=Amycolatopsis sp. NBC_00355 TaxID=2975957 RepID=UPI002E25255F
MPDAEPGHDGQRHRDDGDGERPQRMPPARRRLVGGRRVAVADAVRGTFRAVKAVRGTLRDVRAPRGTFRAIRVVRGTLTAVKAVRGTFRAIRILRGTLRTVKAVGVPLTAVLRLGRGLLRRVRAAPLIARLVLRLAVRLLAGLVIAGLVVALRVLPLAVAVGVLAAALRPSVVLAHALAPSPRHAFAVPANAAFLRISLSGSMELLWMYPPERRDRSGVIDVTLPA